MPQPKTRGGRGKVFVHVPFPYTREATERVGRNYLRQPTSTYKQYALYNARVLVTAAEEYAEVLCVHPGMIATPEWEMSDGQVLAQLIEEELDRLLSLDRRVHVHMIGTRYPSCETESDAQRAHERAVEWCVRHRRSYDFLDPRRFRVSFACDRDRSDRTLRAMMNSFGFLQEDRLEVFDDIRFPKSLKGWAAQQIFKPVDFLLQLTPWGKRKKYGRRQWQIRRGNLLYDPGYSLVD